MKTVHKELIALTITHTFDYLGKKLKSWNNLDDINHTISDQWEY